MLSEEITPRADWKKSARGALALLTCTSTAAAAWWYAHLIAVEGIALLEIALTVLFTILYLWIALSFWTATLGFVSLMTRPKQRPPANHPPVAIDQLPRSALLMPIYNEDPTSVLAGVSAMLRSLQACGAAQRFDFFLLSDSTNPDVWLKEERAWARLVAENESDVRVFYRHRPRNVGRKAGNIADFCTRWGDHYPYMLVLDADSVMAGGTLVEMVRQMEQDHEIGILQVPPLPVGRASFFARMQQFAARLYGPVFLEGFALWSQCDGNYWGHNAIIRIQPFMEHCDLPVLSGTAPLGGEILSHDFVEAALMRRAGWKVCLAHDLAGSYEECPTTMLDYAQRDRRWCQGNLQHSRLLFAEGIHPISRLHLAMGVMSYLSSPLWLLFLLLTVVQALIIEAGTVQVISAATAFWLFSLTMAMLLVPKFYSLIALRNQPQRIAEHGGWSRLIWSVWLEIFTSALIAPIMMLLHTTFVVTTLCGSTVTWNSQSRDDRGARLREALLIHYPHTLFGLGLGLFVWYFVPGLFPWMTPVLVGPLLSIPLSMVMGSVGIGQRLAERQLLQIPEEVNEPAVLQAKRETQRNAAHTSSTRAKSDLFEAVLFEPAFYALHVGILKATTAGMRISPEDLQRVKTLLSKAGSRALPQQARRVLLNDPVALESLHIFSRSQLMPDRSAL